MVMFVYIDLLFVVWFKQKKKKILKILTNHCQHRNWMEKSQSFFVVVILFLRIFGFKIVSWEICLKMIDSHILGSPFSYHGTDEIERKVQQHLVNLTGSTKLIYFYIWIDSVWLAFFKQEWHWHSVGDIKNYILPNDLAKENSMIKIDLHRSVWISLV